jgi:hypothetical protein
VATPKYFLHPIWVIYFLPTSPVTLTLGLQIGGRFLKGNYLDQLLWSTNHKKQGAATLTQIIVIALFSGQVICFAEPCTSPQQTVQNSAKCTKMLGQNHFVELNRHILTFLHPILICRGHVLSGVCCKGTPHGSLPPMNLKRWIVHYIWANYCIWSMRNSHLLLLAL